MKTIKYLMFGLCIFIIQQNVITAQQQVSITEINAEKGIKLNFNAGFHFSNMIGEGIEKSSYFHLHKKQFNSYTGEVGDAVCSKFLPGYKFGIGITFDKTKYFAWGFDLNFETKGCQIPIERICVYDDYEFISCDNTSSQLLSTIRLNYLVLPVRFEFKYKKIYFMPGAYTGFLLKANETTKLDYENQHLDFRNDISYWYAPIDLGVFLNTGFCIPLSENNSIKIGLVGEWNVNGLRKRGLKGGVYRFYSNQVLGLELKYELKIK